MSATILGKLGIMAGAAFLLHKNSEASTPKTPAGKINYNFTPNHIEVQNRIDRILGDGFSPSFKTNGSFGAASNFKTFPSTEGDMDTAKLVFMQQLCASGYANVAGNTCSLNRADTIGTVNRWINEGKLTYTGGWVGTSWLHGKSPDDLMQTLFKVCTDGNDFKPAINPGDTYKAYSYPSPNVPNGADHFKYFIRCAEKELTCMLFGKTISIATILVLVGSIAATIVTAGGATPLLIASIGNLGAQVANIVGSPDLNKSVQIASEMANIYAGASIQVTGGTPEQMRDVAGDYVNNSGVFQPVS